MVANPLFEELADMPLSYRHSTTYLVSITVHEDDDRHDVMCFCVVWEVGVNPTLTLNILTERAAAPASHPRTVSTKW